MNQPIKNHPKLFRSLFNLTADDPKIPTDINLDQDIDLLGMYMHVVWPLLKKIIKAKIWFFLRYKWKRWLKNLISTILIIVSTYYAWIKVAKPIFIKEEKTIVEEIYVSNLKPYNKFLYEVGKAESGNIWNIHSEGSSMLGRFQFSPSTLKLIGIDVEANYFLNDSNLQLAAFKRLMHINKKYFEKYISKWNGKVLPQDKRYVITESGILMAFHLKPSGAVRYFDSGCIDDSDTDGNGTPVSAYVKKFSGYRVE